MKFKSPPTEFSRSPIDHAWAAGFFDGEGCTYFKRRLGQSGQPELVICQKEPSTLERFQRIVGCGAIYLDKSMLYHWRAYAVREVEHVVELLWPHLSEPKRMQMRGVLDTYAEQVERSPASQAKTHCKHGHKFTEANTYVHRGYRACRACRAEHRRAQRERKAVV